MAYLPSLQKPVQATTQAAFSSWFEYMQRQGDKENLYPSLSASMQGATRLEHTWAIDYALKNSYPNGEILEEESRATVTSSQTLGHSLYGIDGIWKTWSGLSSILPYSLESRSGSSSTFENPRSKAWEIFCSLALNLQDLLVIKQLWEERNALIHGHSSIKTKDSGTDLAIILPNFLEDQANLTVASPTINTQSLEQLYSFRKPEETLRFLEENPFLAPLLEEAYIHIREYFLHEKVFLEVVADPEAVGEKQLVVFIVVEQKPNEASQALDDLDEDWWLDAMERAQDKLCITLEFR